MSDDKRLLGELKGMLEAHGDLLTEIRADVKAQNGRVRKLETDVVRVKAYWSAGVFGIAMVWPYLKAKLGL